MTTRKNMIDAFRIDNYIITLESLKNTVNGNPRFKAVIIALEDGTTNYYNAVYTFHGHYMNRAQEAAWILDYHKKNNNNK